MVRNAPILMLFLKRFGNAYRTHFVAHNVNFDSFVRHQLRSKRIQMDCATIVPFAQQEDYIGIGFVQQEDFATRDIL
jgi:hypothetical protein